MKKFLSTFFLFIMAFTTMAQDNGVEMATTLRSSGKIYVVVAVILVIFIGIAFYLFTIDRRLSKIEKNQVRKPEL